MNVQYAGPVPIVLVHHGPVAPGEAVAIDDATGALLVRRPDFAPAVTTPARRSEEAVPEAAAEEAGAPPAPRSKRGSAA